MSNDNQTVDNLVYALKERAKELSCLYQIGALFNNSENSMGDICRGIIKAIPKGWQYPDICIAKIAIEDSIYQSPDFHETEWVQSADISIQEKPVGKISVYYTRERPAADEGPFLKEERKLISTISERLERRILHEKLKMVFEETKLPPKHQGDWCVIVDLLKQTDPKLLTRISRKMLNHLCWSGVEEAERLLEHFSPSYRSEESELIKEINSPYQKRAVGDILAISEDLFKIAATHLSEKEILSSIQKWIKEDRSGFLVNILENPGSSLVDIINAVERYHHLMPQGLELPPLRKKVFRVALIRRLLTDQPQFVNIAKHFIEVDDFYDLLHNITFPAGSRGKLGGKSSGLFLAVEVLKNASRHNEHLRHIKTPKTRYLASDGILSFIKHNNLEEMVEQKYKEIGQVRQEYPYVVHLFKNSPLPPEIIKGLSATLDDLGDVPLIVRSSSLLEDRLGTAFAGKYKSLFIANQGSKEERLVALMDAVTEVYASTIGPDPIEYRVERGMIDFHEEMGIMIQEVVGTRVGRYYLPAFAGVAFSHNEFRWSRRIKREDGLVRMVPGLGTRAVDRLSDDYPTLISPGEPELRVNVTLDEKIRYSPKKIDVINLETNAFETMEIRDLLKECGNDYPMVEQLVSILDKDRICSAPALGFDFDKDYPVVTFDGLINQTIFIEQMRAILNVLQDKFETPVDIEFAHDGTDFFILQCRPLSYGREYQPAAIPRDVPEEKIIFSANRYVPNGTVSDITHIVYVDPQKYSKLNSQSDLLAVGKAVNQLNQILPKRQFILIGPGRWGSRGDIKLGVSVTYSSINNTAMLIEIARKQKDYVPDVSFGTHFFQDLVEASIRYLPLYPDDYGIVFNEKFLTGSENMLGDTLPEFAYLSDTIRLIDVNHSTDGLILRVLMNGDKEEAMAILTESTETIEIKSKRKESAAGPKKTDDHWRWRQRNIERLALQIDPQRFGIKGFYIFGSTKNATAGPASDIDVLIHFQGTKTEKKELLSWLEGWSLCLSQINFLRTGQETDGLLDIHLVTDEDIKNRTSYAIKIGAMTDAARPLPMGKTKKS
jgi:pyruvate, water dikinase